MKICYIDETGSEDCAKFYVMVGICFDFTKHSICSRTANFKIAKMRQLYLEKNKKYCPEIKTKKFIRGKDNWSSIPHSYRDNFITEMIQIFQTNSTNSFEVYVSVIDNEKYENLQHEFKKDIDGKWVTNALHIILQRETAIYGTSKNKKNKALTFMIYDNHIDIKKLNDLLYTPKKYLYDYFIVKKNKKIKHPSFDAVIDEGFCIDSRHSGLCQLADICAYIIRRYIELQTGYKEEYNGEKEKFSTWYNLIKDKIYLYPKVFSKTPENSILDFYNNIMPKNIYKILKGE